MTADQFNEVAVLADATTCTRCAALNISRSSVSLMPKSRNDTASIKYVVDNHCANMGGSCIHPEFHAARRTMSLRRAAN